MNFEEILIEGERAATFMRLSAIHAATGRAVSYRCAQFLRFSDGELVEFRALIDSFDAAEQVLGHPINTSLDAPMEIAARGNRVALWRAWSLAPEARPAYSPGCSGANGPATASGVGVSGTVGTLGASLSEGLFWAVLGIDRLLPPCRCIA
jgi:hypothetical protein